jgi:hypothetical protein
VRRDGSLFPVSYVSVPLELAGGRGAVVAFSELEERLRAEQVLREHDAVLARQEASLRRIATLVAAGAASAEVFAVIAREVAQMLELPLVLILRYGSDQTVRVLADWSEQPHRFQTGTRWPLDSPSVSALVAAPILVDGTLWGSIATGQIGRGTLPTQIEERLAGYTDLVATAISNSSNREELARLAAEQTALRRVATLVAQAVPPADLFSAVSEPSSEEYPPPADVALVQAAVIRPKRPFGSEMRRIATAPVYGSSPYKCTVDSHARLSSTCRRVRAHGVGIPSSTCSTACRARPTRSSLDFGWPRSPTGSSPRGTSHCSSA